MWIGVFCVDKTCFLGPGHIRMYIVIFHHFHMLITWNVYIVSLEIKRRLHGNNNVASYLILHCYLNQWCRKLFSTGHGGTAHYHVGHNFYGKIVFPCNRTNIWVAPVLPSSYTYDFLYPRIGDTQWNFLSTIQHQNISLWVVQIWNKFPMRWFSQQVNI